MKKALARLFFALAGWKLKVTNKQAVVPSVMIAAPHTSNWDFPYALAAFWLMEIPLRYFIKDSYTKGPLGFFFRWTGAIGVDRKNRGSGLTQFAIDLLRKDTGLVILVPAEGTRKRVEKWKTGFYRIATEAGVPISLGYLDYAKKEAGVGLTFQPEGVFEKDMQRIQDFYSTISGKFPADYNPNIY